MRRIYIYLHHLFTSLCHLFFIYPFTYSASDNDAVQSSHCVWQCVRPSVRPHQVSGCGRSELLFSEVSSDPAGTRRACSCYECLHPKAERETSCKGEGGDVVWIKYGDNSQHFQTVAGERRWKCCTHLCTCKLTETFLSRPKEKREFESVKRE